ncbi:hypothetical protein BASA62_010492 [Batrachochytrium salamandrivorans]|nr:hypothetical protein BASA62_010492 [Batrachochytrium salamandrivorans]
MAGYYGNNQDYRAIEPADTCRNILLLAFLIRTYDATEYAIASTNKWNGSNEMHGQCWDETLTGSHQQAVVMGNTSGTSKSLTSNFFGEEIVEITGVNRGSWESYEYLLSTQCLPSVLALIGELRTLTLASTLGVLLPVASPRIRSLIIMRVFSRALRN